MSKSTLIAATTKGVITKVKMTRVISQVSAIFVAGGGGSGSLTSFSAGNLTPLFTTSVATPTSTPALTFALVNQNANLVYAGPNSGGAAAPTFRSLVTSDMTLTNGHIIVGNGSNLAADVSMSGDVSIVNTGQTTIGSQRVGISKMLVTTSPVLLGRTTAGSGAAEQISVNNGLTLSSGAMGLGGMLTSNTFIDADTGGGFGLTFRSIFSPSEAKLVISSGGANINISGKTASNEIFTLYADYDGSVGGQIGLFFIDSRVTPLGFQYAADYSATYTSRSLVDKAYVLAHVGSGTVTTVSVVTNQGVSGSVANPTTTPAITLTLGALTGVTSFNGLIVTANTGVITTGTWNGTAITAGNGGTGISSYAVGDIIYASASTTLSKLAAIATGSVLGSAGVTTAPAYLTVSNGLTATSSTFKLGGSLTGATNITATTTNTLTFETDALGATGSVANESIFIVNGTAAANNAQQISPITTRRGNGWKTTATAASQTVDILDWVLPIQGAANPTGQWVVASSVNAAATVTLFTLDTTTGNGVFTGSLKRDSTNNVPHCSAGLTGGNRVVFASGSVVLASDANFIYTSGSGITVDGVTLADAKNIAFGTTTGTKIGATTSQKLAFWNAAPIVQLTTGVAAAAFTANTSAISNDTATWGGYTVGQIVQSLKNLGFLA